MNYHYNLARFFEDNLKIYKDNPALIFDIDEQYSYDEINRKANQIARYFLSRGIKRKQVVAILNTKTFDSFAAMLACLKIGAIYANIDPDNAIHRIEKNLKTCDPILVLSDVENHQTHKLCKNLKVEYSDFEEIKRTFTEFETSNLDITKLIDGSNPAYIMFTSGSTGIPKGVLISHQNVIHLINWSINEYQVSEDDRLTNVNPIYFDNSVFDFYTALFSGAALVPFRKELTNRPNDLIKKIDELGCTIWFSVPSFLIYLDTMKVFSSSVFKTIRIISFGGEGFHKKPLKRLYDAFHHRTRFINVYGPTEGTCICSSYEITDNDFEKLDSIPPIGRINQNFDYLIIDDDSMSDHGELCLLGPNVGLGYYNDDEKTRKKFIENPFNKRYSEIMYKTGDLVEEKNGLLFFIGRVDNQIKHMGYRIELEEIEFALNSISEVNQAAVVYKKTSELYGKIVAFVALDTDLSKVEIMKKLQDLIPEYMIPHIFKELDQLPKNQNGKIDKQELLKVL
jgi:D-alanine--poly(phosphoribitol) ligase subunit 1